MHRRSQGDALGASEPTRAEKKIWTKFTGESCKCTPRQSKSPIFLGNWGDLDGGNGQFSSFSLCFEGNDYKKRSSTFSRKKSAPP